jgi:hypothetical protein
MIWWAQVRIKNQQAGNNNGESISTFQELSPSGNNDPPYMLLPRHAQTAFRVFCRHVVLFLFALGLCPSAHSRPALPYRPKHTLQ